MKGQKLPEDFINKTVDFDQYMRNINHHPNKGTIGCSMSHIEVWRAFLESDYEYALVLEDDANLTRQS